MDTTALANRPGRGNKLSTALQPIETFEHVNLNDVDDSRKALPENVYTFEVNKLDPVYKKIQNPSSEFYGKEVLVLKGSYTIVDDQNYSGRKVWTDFYTVYKFALVNLKKQMNATGVTQADGESLQDYAEQFATLNPPARFQAILTAKPDKRDPEGPIRNEINFYTAKPC